MRWLVRSTVVAAVVGVVVLLVANAVVIVGGRTTSDGNGTGNGQVALVLGAGLRPDGGPSLMLAGRLTTTARLYRRGTVRRVLASGDHGTIGHDEVRAMRERLVELGVPDEAIFTDHAGFDTWSTMVRAKEVFGASDVTIVTQRFHLARAVWLARRAGLRAKGVAADANPYGGAGRTATVREALARAKAVTDVVTHRRPRYLGPPIDLNGDGTLTKG